MPGRTDHAAPADAPIPITMGEPGGIGPEIATAAWRALGGRVGKRALKLVGDASVFEGAPRDTIIESHALGAPLKTGHADPANTPAVVDAIDTAVAMAMQGAAGAGPPTPPQHDPPTQS